MRNILQNERAAPLWVCQENVCPLLAFCTHAPCAASWQFFTAIAETHIMLLQIPDYPRHIMLYLWVMVLLKHWLMYFYRSTLRGEAAPPYIYQNVDSISLFAESVTFPRSQRLKAFFANYFVSTIKYWFSWSFLLTLALSSANFECVFVQWNSCSWPKCVTMKNYVYFLIGVPYHLTSEKTSHFWCMSCFVAKYSL